MKRAMSAALVLFCVLGLVGCGKQQQIKGKQLLAESTVTTVTVASEPTGYLYSFVGEDAKMIVDYLYELRLAETENPWRMGMSWAISLEYDDGTALTVYHCGEYIVVEKNWYKITNDDGSRFDTLLSELTKR